MKGSAPFFLGIFMMIMITIIFVMDKSIFYSRHVDVAAGSVKLYELEGVSESLKRSLDSVAKFETPLAVYDYGTSEKYMDEKTNTFEQAKAAFEGKVKQRISAFSPAELDKKDIEWKDVSLSVSFGKNRKTNSDEIKVSGSHGFSVKNRESPNATIIVAGKFESATTNRLAPMILASRQLFDETSWFVSRSVSNSETDECKNKFGASETINTKNLLQNAILCGYKNKAGVRSVSVYNAVDVNKKINDVLAEISSDFKTKYNFDFAFQPTITEARQEGKYKISVSVAGNIIDNSVKILTASGEQPMKFIFNTKTEFDMPAGSQASQG